jgi:Tripartite tricarboxylate transporter family receptor
MAILSAGIRSLLRKAEGADLSRPAEAVIEGYAGLAGAYQTGQLKALAIASQKRLPDLANVPTVAETLPGFVAVGWQCVVAPVGMPQAIVRKISDDLRAVLVKPEIKDKLAARGGYVHPADPAEAEAFVRSQQGAVAAGAGAGGPAVPGFAARSGEPARAEILAFPTFAGTSVEQRVLLRAELSPHEPAIELISGEAIASDRRGA